MNSKKSLVKFFISFGRFIKSETVRSKIRKRSNDFTRKLKFPWYDVLYYLIFRNEKNTPAELTKYYSSIGKSDLRISRQAAFKAFKKVNPNVFYCLIEQFSKLFYKTDLVKKHKGYLLIAADGTTNNLVATEESLDQYGFIQNQYILSKEDAIKATCRSMALYDVTNGLIVDFSMNPFKRSEIPLVIEQLDKCHSLFRNQKSIFLADRYFGSVELFSILEHYGMNYCIRGKTNFFKKQIAEMKSNDEWISVTLNKAWQKRLKHPIAKDRFEKDSELKIRVVKFKHTYMDKEGHLVTTQLIYFTNLSQDEFDTNEIISLYSKRWDIECSYKTLKTDYEWERYFSKDSDTETCAILAKVIFHNINGIIRKELNEELETLKNKDNKYGCVVNIVQLSQLLRHNLLHRYMRNGNRNSVENILQLTYDLIHKIKVPVRPDRHNKRWGRHATSSNPTRFRIDGRNWPNTVYANGHMHTVAPQ